MDIPSNHRRQEAGIEDHTDFIKDLASEMIKKQMLGILQFFIITDKILMAGLEPVFDKVSEGFGYRRYNVYTMYTNLTY